MFDEGVAYRRQASWAAERADACRAAALRLHRLRGDLTDGLQDCIDALAPQTWSSPAADARRQALADAGAHLGRVAEELHERATGFDQAASLLEQQATDALLQSVAAIDGRVDFVTRERPGQR